MDYLDFALLPVRVIYRSFFFLSYFSVLFNIRHKAIVISMCISNICHLSLYVHKSLVDVSIFWYVEACVECRDRYTERRVKRIFFFLHKQLSKSIKMQRFENVGFFFFLSLLKTKFSIS